MDELQILDQPQILQILFYPRRDSGDKPSIANAITCFIPVEEDVSISCRFYSNNKSSPNILFFHGNGEIASDYDDIATIFTHMGVNLFVADYRGYGMSGGNPTVSSMMRDAHLVFDGAKQMLGEKGYYGEVFVMGRSLGSASAIELAYHYQQEIKGLIIESGFADIINLLTYIGIPLKPLGLDRKKVFSNRERIRSISIPTLIIHAEHDHIIPLQEGKDLYHNAGAKDKRLVIIPKANHNNIFLVGMKEYLQAMTEFIFAS
jgi:hypothetical protein